ncbi:hypothetical protein CTAYLR_003570 [Chrysophaeum taylorii]|uniref:Las1-like protein n=1 Tax=Chrysophaeum taylorii TaxID=2483200 RepID=A0AAD7XP50_9STRA|nr:hypothetical protein CTAYLR_003570 [Chrysophaeum taylorii]
MEVKAVAAEKAHRRVQLKKRKLQQQQTEGRRVVPRVVPWAEWEEWRWVHGALYSDDPEARRRAVSRCLIAWRLRGGLPHAVECTAQLVACRDRECGVEHERLELAMIVTRCVNGLVDKGQRSSRALPIVSLARAIKLPAWVVDVRHQATHNALPSLDVLRAAGTELLGYLRRYYWSAQERALAKTVARCALAVRNGHDLRGVPPSTLARVRADSDAARDARWPGLDAACLESLARRLLAVEPRRSPGVESEIRRLLGAHDSGAAIYRLWDEAMWVWRHKPTRRAQAAALAEHLAATQRGGPQETKRPDDIAEVERRVAELARATTQGSFWSPRFSWTPAPIGAVLGPIEDVYAAC